MNADSAQQTRNALNRLKAGRIERVRRGVYQGK
jgi:predicted transcriptional regulator of viral defense system